MLERVHHRLQRIAATMLQKDFPRLRAHHELESVVDEAWARLVQALESCTPETAEQFYGLVFHKVRQVLLDMARTQSKADKRQARALAKADSSGSDGQPVLDPGDDTNEPSRLAIWTEFHEEVEKLPENQRLVFDLHYVGEFSQLEVAQLLNLHPKKVSRLWLSATGHLAQWLDGFQGVM
jgi:RNA polymerase sigma-70 factor (ECF subfamily)